LNRQEELQSAEPQQRDKGFTLIELLIVIVILGILSTIVVLSVRGITDQGKASACSADEKTLEVAYEAASAKGGVLPVSGNAEAALVAGGLLRSESTKYNIDAAGALTVVDPACGPVTAPATVATAGSPGTFNGVAPANFAAMTGITASPSGDWTNGQFVQTLDAGQAHWFDGAWVQGAA